MPDLPPSAHRDDDATALTQSPVSENPADASTRVFPAPLERTAAPHLPRAFGEYELLAEVGRGGMGVVYKARQIELDRVVAIKMILPGHLASPEEVERFRAEAEAAARLRHPNIVAVYDVGQVDGQHYYTMEFVEGPSLTRRLAEGPLPGPLAARYVMQLAQAVEHAHRNGVLHRDLKPSNVLLDGEDQPRVTDFGLAKRLGSDACRTETGAVLGTPSYMSPEQAAGRNREIGPACDIYGLGAVLYELLTGRPPFKSDTSMDTLVQVMEQDPAPPRLLNARVDPDLETVCLKCLEKSPARRYASAGALAEELRRYLDGDPVTARSLDVFDRLARALERGPHAAEFRSWGVMLLIFGAVVFAGHFLTFLLVEAHQSPVWHWVSRIGQVVILGFIFWRFRGPRPLWPTTSAERQLWSIWMGYLLALAATGIVAREILPIENRWGSLAIYPFAAVLTGLAFFVMGSSFWGMCYPLGLAFFAVGLAMPVRADLAPLEFGVVWGAALLAMGLHLRRLGGEGKP